MVVVWGGSGCGGCDGCEDWWGGCWGWIWGDGWGWVGVLIGYVVFVIGGNVMQCCVW